MIHGEFKVKRHHVNNKSTLIKHLLRYTQTESIDK